MQPPLPHRNLKKVDFVDATISSVYLICPSAKFIHEIG